MATDEDRLIAWLDGELPSEEAEELADRVAHDAALAALADRYRSMDRRLRDGFSPLLDKPPPAWFGEAISGAKPSAELIDLSAARPKFTRSLPGWQAGLAAAAVLLIAIAAGWGLRDVTPALVAPDAAGVLKARGALAHALDVQLASTVPSNQPGAVRIGLTFRARDDRVCRTFEAKALAGVACRARDVWIIAEVSSVTPGEGQYRMAGETPAQMAAVDAMLLQGPFDATVEARLAKTGWR